MAGLDDYLPIVGRDTIEEIRLLGERLAGKSVLNVNSTAVGGGVAEILNRLVPLMNELGLKARWDVIKGGESFYATTKKFHNALHGEPADISPRDYEVYERTQAENLAVMDLHADFVFIHDPQPAGLVRARRPGTNRWIWRCHIDQSLPDRALWDYLKMYVRDYDACVFSAPIFTQELQVLQALIPPSIDPLSDKNREMAPEEIDAVLTRLRIPRDKPLVTQVSRFDRLKDPLGVIEAFRKAKPYCNARLLLVGGSADDDPEGTQVLAEVLAKTGKDPDIMVLSLPPTSHLEVNAIQRASTVIVQKSLREGFGLTVAEALWKGKPVIGGAVGGIPLQITHKYSGILTRSIEGTAYWLKQLLNEPAFARRLGDSGREHVRQNFLITRQLRDNLLLFLAVERPGMEMIRL
jgi:trehalose synthase